MTAWPPRGSAPHGGRAYHVEAVIGRGGFGTVYRAQLVSDGSFQKVVALKILNPQMERIDEVARRMRDEARLLGLVSHRAIVRCDALVRLNGRWTIVMEHIGGVDLLAILRVSAVPPSPALEIVAEAAGALHHAWTAAGPDGEALGILHRDVKPSNIRITAAGAVKLLDFGIARADFDTREANTGLLTFGSETYLSPERLDHLDSHAGDVYALGCVLYELLIRKAYGRSSSNQERYQAHLDERLALAHELLDGQPQDLLRLLEDMLAFDPKVRPSARDVESRCAQLQAHWPGERLRDWAERVVPQVEGYRSAPEADDLVGSTLREQTGDDVLFGVEMGRGLQVEPEILEAEEERTQPRLRDQAPEPAPTPEPAHGSSVRQSRRRNLVWIALGGLALGAAVLVLLSLRHPDEAPAPEAPVPLGTPPEAPAPTVLEPPSPSAEPRVEPAAPPPPVERRTATVARPLPAPPEPEALGGTTVQLDGDATEVVLVGGGGRVALPGRISPGSYEILASFPGYDLAGAGRVTLVEGATITLTCKSGFRRCQVR